jgi:tetratricopeptide (TPR) repeat protein
MPRVPRIAVLGCLALLWWAPAPAGAQPGRDPATAARELVRQGRLEEAAPAYTRAVDDHPASLELRKERGRVLGWLRRYAEALSDFDHVLTITPADAEARIRRARVLAWTGQLAVAEAEYRRALADDPRAAEAHTGLGDLLRWQRRHAEAALEYERARAMAPGDPAPLVALARVRAGLDDLAGARALYEEALRVDPGNTDARAGLAQVAAVPASRPFRLDLGFRYEVLDLGLGDWHQETIQLLYRSRRGLAVLAGVDQYRRFDEDDTQVTGGIVWQPADRLALAATVTFGPGADVVAREIYDLEATYQAPDTRVGAPGGLSRGPARRIRRSRLRQRDLPGQ